MAITAIPVGSQLLVKVGDAASPEVFAHPCIINLDRAINISHTYEEDEIPDCDTPTNPHSIKREVRSIDVVITGSGKVNASDIDTYLDWAKDGTTKNVQAQVGPASSGRTITGAFYCQIEFTGQVKRYAECNITLTPADTGALTVAAAS